MDKSKENSSNFFKSTAFIIIIIVALILAIAIPVGYIFYLDYLNTPNFVSSSSNYITVSAQQASPGDELTYTINLANEGRKDVTDVHITTDMPQYTSISSQDIDYLEHVDRETISFMVGLIKVGQSRQLTYTVTVDNPLDHGTVIANNSFKITYRRQGEQEKIEKKFETSLETAVESNIDFAESYYKITDENGEYIRMGDNLNIVFFIKNSGNMIAEDVKIKGIIPDNTGYVEGSFTSADRLYGPGGWRAGYKGGPDGDRSQDVYKLFGYSSRRSYR
ncbi:MAG: hypothetical protein U5N58_02225 [Actinomycetota bacterium]|nr:hypothetical protein [Actinomycetota bacterium]